MSSIQKTFQVPKPETLKAVFKVQAVIPADEIIENLNNEISRATEAEGNLQNQIDIINGDIDNISEELETKADKEHTYTTNQVNNLLREKANDNAVVHLEGNETIDGDKTFQSNIIIGMDGAITCHQGWNLINEVNNTVSIGNTREPLALHSRGRATTNNENIATDNTVASDIQQHNNDETAHQFIQLILSGEISDRENAIRILQEQIDSIVASSNVKDYVDTFTDLQNYDKSTLGNRDIVVVLSDETHNYATSYYRYLTATNTFNHIGSISAYYTKAESDGRYVPLTRKINGKSLSSDITLTYADVGALPDTTVIPTVNNGVLTIKINDETEATFTANQSSNTLLNISIPRLISELTNNSGYITSAYHDNTKQNKTDDSLTTTDKTVIGAINELKAKITELETLLSKCYMSED